MRRFRTRERSGPVLPPTRPARAAAGRQPGPTTATVWAVKCSTTHTVLNLQSGAAHRRNHLDGRQHPQNSTGYNLTQLMVGLRGHAGHYHAVFSALPYPQHNILMLVPFFRRAQAAEAVSFTLEQAIIPSGMGYGRKPLPDLQTTSRFPSHYLKTSAPAHRTRRPRWTGSMKPNRLCGVLPLRR
jgi:hypothetical protein